MRCHLQAGSQARPSRSRTRAVSQVLQVTHADQTTLLKALAAIAGIPEAEMGKTVRSIPGA